ncbi:MAG: hypothetical protein F4X83_08715 [Chloroflexi bacterium]|nr:hypothetical protein [Chloroflexota bacterium]
MKKRVKDGVSLRSAKTWIVVAGIAIVVLGVLMAIQSAGSDTSAAGDLTKMEVTQRNYDWGVSKRGGQPEEDAHRYHLDTSFETWFANHGNYRMFRVMVPDDLIMRLQGGERVVYNVENIYHRYVEDKADCNNERPEGTVRFTRLNHNDQQRTAEVWKQVEPEDRSLHSCLIVKLQGAIFNSPDTHPEWAFFGAADSGSAIEPTWPKIRVVADENRVTAYSLAGASGLEFHWKYRILDEAGACDHSAFNLAPNHPSVHNSNVFHLPDAPDARAYYEGRYVCFQATIVNIDHPDYDPGDSVTRYGLIRL